MTDLNPGLADRLSAILQSKGVRGIEGDDELWDQLASAYLDSGADWLDCKQVFREKKILREMEARVKRIAHRKQRIHQIGSPRAHNAVRDVWTDAPVSGESFAPDNYTIQNGMPSIDRIERKFSNGAMVENRILVSSDPIVVVRRMEHTHSSEVLLEVAWRTGFGNWRAATFNRDVLMSTRKVVDTSLHGLPVSSITASEVVRWIAEYERANVAVIPRAYVTNCMGWQGTAKNPTAHGFLCGTRQIGGNGHQIELHGSDGDMADAREIRCAGALDSWRTAIGRLAHHPAVRIAIYAALAAPMLAVLDGPNAIIEWAGRTSTGKSTVMRLAQSCWKSANVSLPTWNATHIAIEAQAAVGSDLPLFVDDTNAAVEGGRSSSIGKMIYQLCSGRARGRGARDGGQRLRSSWRTIALSTGEQPVAELAKAEGAAARVLTFWSAPLGPTSVRTAQTATEVLAELGEHHGHAGPLLVQWLCEHRDRWKALRELGSSVARRMRIELTTPAASRLSEVVGVLEATACVAHEAIGLPWASRSLLDDPEIVAAIRGGVELSSATSDRAALALEHALGVAQSRPHSWLWWGTRPGGSGAPDDSDRRDPPGGWLGYRSLVTSDPRCHAWYPHQLRKVLEEGGFQPDSVLRAWKDLGMLVNTEHGRFTSQIYPAGRDSRMRMIVVKDFAFEDPHAEPVSKETNKVGTKNEGWSY